MLAPLGRHSESRLRAWLILSDARVEVDVKHWGFAETLETVSSLTLVDISKERLISHLLHC